MKQFKIDIIIFCGLLLLASVFLLLTLKQRTIDIQLHDTYIVLDKTSLVFLIIGPSMFLIYFIRGLILKFKIKGTNVGLIIALILMTVITYRIIQFQQTYIDYILSEVKNFDSGMTNTEPLVADARHKINLTWALFGFWMVGILFLTVRTVTISRMRSNV